MAEAALAPLTKLTLVQKLIRVYEEVDHIEKRGRNTLQNYNYVKASDVANSVRKAFAKLGIYAEVNFSVERQYTIERGQDKQPFVAIDVKCSITFHDSESDKTFTTSGIGTGADMSDKAPYKAQTGAIKYALRNAFLVPDEADPENDEAEVPRPSAQRTNTPASAPKTPPVNQKPAEEGQSRPEQSQKDLVPNSGTTEPQKGTAGPVLPTKEERDGYYERCKSLTKTLAPSGLKGKELSKYLTLINNVTDLDKISSEQWKASLSILDMALKAENGPAEVVKIIQTKIKESK